MPSMAVLFEPPLALPRFVIGGYWHERASDDPVLVWVRGQLKALGIERLARKSRTRRASQHAVG